MQKLEFGTAGIRGILGEGEHQLNTTHIIRIIDGFARYLISNFEKAKERGIVIGRDNRRESKNFSQIVAVILTKYKINVYYNEEIAPTPFISYATRSLGAIGAVNITASHNPKEYNGVKIYDEFGCQLLPKQITTLLKYFKPYEIYINEKIIFNKNKYFNLISNSLFESYINEISKIGGKKYNFSNINVAYSPQHGTGAKPIKKIFNDLNIKGYYEEREMVEDTEFTYCKNPNPEVKESFNNVLEVAKKYDCDIALITDPDADRVGLAINHNNKFEILTGNETAILIFVFLINQIKKTNLNQYYLIYSFVSSSLPQKIAQKYGIKHYVTETGFKWIGDLIENLSKSNPEQKFLFAFEESYGSLINENICRDKDALQSVIILVKMASYYKEKGMNLIQVLNKIYEEHGFVKSGTIVLNIESKNHLDQIIKKFKNIKLDEAKFVDYNVGIGLIEPNDMLAYEFKNKSWISLRKSGTEPKIKIYLFFIDKTQEKVTYEYNKYYNLLLNL